MVDTFEHFETGSPIVVTLARPVRKGLGKNFRPFVIKINDTSDHIGKGAIITFPPLPVKQPTTFVSSDLMAYVRYRSSNYIGLVLMDGRREIEEEIPAGTKLPIT